MKPLLLFYTLIIFFYNFLVSNFVYAETIYTKSAFEKNNSFSTLVKTSLDDKTIKKPKQVITVPVLDILSNKIKAKDTMGNLKIFSDKDYVAITINGEIYKQIYHSIKFWLDKYDTNKDKALIFLINSTGGHVNPIKDFKKNIDTKRLTTIITGEALSAAAMLFFLGYRKLMFQHSLLGFHASQMRLDYKDQIFKQKSSKDSLNINQKYLPKDNTQQKRKLNNFLNLVEKTGGFSSLKMSYFNTKTLVKHNLVQQIDTHKIIIDKVWIKTQDKFLKCKTLF